MDALTWALRYAERGWRVYPIERGAKKALFTGWQTSATKDPELIERQWRRDPYPNVGVICGGSLAVFDIEAPHLPAIFDCLDARGLVLPETPVSSTGRGGIHIYVKPVAGITTTRKVRLNGIHIGEFKASGGVVAPPSSTVGPYSWLWWPDDTVPAPAPRWLAAMIEPSLPVQHSTALRRPPDPAVALDLLACAVRDEAEGNRNGMLFWAACTARDEGIRLDIAEAVLHRAALAAGLGDPEISATIRSAFGRETVLT